MTAAFAAMLALSMPMAYAQTTQTAPPNETGGQTATEPAAPAGSTGSSAANGEAGTATGKTGGEAAAGNAGAGTEAAKGGVSAVTRLGSGQLLFSKMNGAAVYDKENKSIGDIKNLVLDPNGRVAAVVIQRGGFISGGKTIAVPMNELQMANAKNGNLRFSINMTSEQAKTSPSFDVNPPNTASGSSTAPTGQANGSAGGNGNGNSR